MFANADNLVSQLAMMPDQALKQMAMMHQSDPYMLPLIISEDTRRKQTRAASMSGQGPQPKVVDQAVAGIGQLLPQPEMPGALPPAPQGQAASQPAAQQPEPRKPSQSGIASLPAPNMKFAEGGIVGYAEGGQTEAQTMRALAGELPEISGPEHLQMIDELTRLVATTKDPEQRAVYQDALNSFLRGAKKLAASLPMGSAQAAPSGNPLVDQIPLTTWGPQNRQLSDQIPGSGPGPAKIEEEKSVFGRMADALGISPEVQRNTYNTLQALTPLATPVSGIVSGIQALTNAARGAQGVGRIGNVARAATLAPALANDATPTKLGEKIADTLSPAPAGIVALVPGPGDADWGKDMTSQDAVSTASPLNPLLQAGQKDIIDAVKETVPAEKRKGYTKDDLLMLGLQLMSNKSPNFLTALGESGIATLQAKKGREKDERDDRKANADISKDSAMAEYYRANAKALGISNKDLSAALNAADKAFDDWKGSVEAITATAAQREAKREELIAKAMGRYGLAAPQGSASYAPMPAGVKVTREK